MITLWIRQLAVLFAYEIGLRQVDEGLWWKGNGWQLGEKYFEAPYWSDSGYFEIDFFPTGLANGEPVQLYVRDSRSKMAAAIVDLVWSAAYYAQNPIVLKLVRPGQPSPVNLTNPHTDQTVFQVNRKAAWSQAVRILNAPDLAGALTRYLIKTSGGTTVLGPITLPLVAPHYRGQPWTGTLALAAGETAGLFDWVYQIQILSTLASGAVVELVPAATIALFEE